VNEPEFRLAIQDLLTRQPSSTPPLLVYSYIQSDDQADEALLAILEWMTHEARTRPCDMIEFMDDAIDQFINAKSGLNGRP